MRFPGSWKTAVLLSGLLMIAVSAGCLEGAGGAADGTTVTESPAVTTDAHAGTETETESRSGIVDEEAKTRALAAEEEYLTGVLENASCVDGWGLTAYGGIYENATIDERTADGLYVEVTHPYWYGTEVDEVDSGTSARYLVSEDATERVDGDDVAPC